MEHGANSKYRSIVMIDLGVSLSEGEGRGVFTWLDLTAADLIKIASM